MDIASKNEIWIPISEIGIQTFCEVQLKFIWKGVKIKTKKMVNGSLIHYEKFKKFERQTRRLESVEIINAIRRAIKKRERFVGREIFIKSPTFRLIGRVDAIEIGPEGIVIIDDKPIEYPFLSAKSQVAAYSLAFKDKYRPPLDIYMMIKNRDKGIIVWKDVFSEEWFSFIIEKINRIYELILGKRNFEPTSNPKKCLSCCYRNFCKSII